MDRSQPAADASVRLTFLEAIDPVCVAFEIVCQETGSPPRIEDYLAEYEGAERQWLLRELLLMEVEYLVRRGEEPACEEYCHRFPDDVRLVRRVFKRNADTLVAAPSGETVSAKEPPPPPIVTDKQFGDYELLEELGKGGMGVVYRARQKGADRDVALKLIRPDRFAARHADQRAELTARFYEEIKAAAKLDHDHIVRVYDVGQLYDQPYFAMQFIEGNGLDELLTESPLAGKEAARLLEPICRAVAAAHAWGIIHRDIKPSNILVDKSGKPYVADFGLAKLHDADQQLTQTGQVLGTPPYMSPEQASGGEMTPASDVYSLGATLYEALTGRPPFQAASIGETLRQVIYKDPLPPSQLNPDIDRDLESICLKCLEKDPAQRYASATDLADDLQRYRHNYAVHARPITPPVRAARWCRRNPLVAGLSGLSLLFLAAAMAFACVGMYVAVAKNREIESAISVSEGKNKTIDDILKEVGELREKVADQAATNASQMTEVGSLKAQLAEHEKSSETTARETVRMTAELNAARSDAQSAKLALDRARWDFSNETARLSAAETELRNRIRFCNGMLEVRHHLDNHRNEEAQGLLAAWRVRAAADQDFTWHHLARRFDEPQTLKFSEPVHWWSREPELAQFVSLTPSELTRWNISRPRGAGDDAPKIADATLPLAFDTDDLVRARQVDLRLTDIVDISARSFDAVTSRSADALTIKTDFWIVACAMRSRVVVMKAGSGTGLSLLGTYDVPETVSRVGIAADANVHVLTSSGNVYDVASLEANPRAEPSGKLGRGVTCWHYMPSGPYNLTKAPANALIVGYQDGNVRSWSKTWQDVAVPLSGLPRAIGSSTPTHSVKTVLVEKPWFVVRPHSAPVESILLGTCIASADQDGIVKLWSPKTNGSGKTAAAVHYTFRDEHGRPYHSLRGEGFTSTGHVAAVRGDDAIVVWNVSTGDIVREIPLRRNFVEYQIDDDAVSVSFEDGAIEFWPIKRKSGDRQYAVTLPVEGRQPLAFATAPARGDYVAVKNETGFFLIHKSGGHARALPPAQKATAATWATKINCLAVAQPDPTKRDNSRILLFADLMTLAIADAPSAVVDVPVPNVKWMYFTTDDSELVGGSEDGELFAINFDVKKTTADSIAKTARLSALAKDDPRRRVLTSSTDVDVGADGTCAVAGRDGAVRVWAPATDFVSNCDQLLEAANPITHVAVSPNGRDIATGTEDGELTIWDAATGKRKAIFRGLDPVRGIAFTSGGRNLMVASDRQISVLLGKE